MNKLARFTRLSILLAAMLGMFMTGQALAENTLTEYAGTCDASGAVSIDEQHFVIANDEDNVLRIYRQDQYAAPISTLDLTAFLKSDPKHPEADLEAAARVGNQIYWISSHGANSSGELRTGRRRLLATRIDGIGENVTLTPVGEPYKALVRDMSRLPALKQYKLGKAAKIAPKETGGLNIEGLAATPDGRLLIGLRGPVPGGKALLIPLNNPHEVITGKPARLGKPIRLALGGRGVRSIEYVPTLGQYLIIAGMAGVGGEFQLYRWSGAPSDSPTPVPGATFAGLQPEAMIVYPGVPTRVQVFSDDGTRQFGQHLCKELPVEQRRFRSVWVTL